MRLLLPIYVGVLASAGLLPAAGALAAETGQGSAEPVEEITVTGDQDALNLQLAIDTAESDFYALFNALVAEEYRVSCKQQIVLGSRIKQRVCQTGFQQEQLTKAAMYSYYGMPYNADAALTAKNTELSTKARELLETNAELRQAASRLSDLVETYKERYTTPD